MALDILFKSDIGLLSLFTILFVIGMAFFFMRMVTKKMNDPRA